MFKTFKSYQVRADQWTASRVPLPTALEYSEPSALRRLTWTKQTDTSMHFTYAEPR